MPDASVSLHHFIPTYSVHRTPWLFVDAKIEWFWAARLKGQGLVLCG